MGYLAVAVLVALYAVGGKVAPGLHIADVIDLNHTRFIPRLRAPLDYWNALALVELPLDGHVDQLRITRHPPGRKCRCREATDSSVVGRVELEQ